MDTKLRRLVKTAALHTSIWSEAARRKTTPLFYYDPVVDVAMVLVVDPHTPKVVHYLDDNVALLYNPENREISGFRIESFEKAFIPKYSKIQDVWHLSSSWKDVQDLGDMALKVRNQETIMAKELSKIAKPVAEKAGMKLDELVLA
jgi:hypothetical protein